MTEAPEAMVPMAVQNELLEGRKLLESMEPQQRLAWGLEQFGETFALTTSFGHPIGCAPAHAEHPPRR